MSTELEARLKALEEAMGLTAPKSSLPDAWLEMIQPVLNESESADDFILDAIRQLVQIRQKPVELSEEEKGLALIKENLSINDKLLAKIDRNLHSLLEYDLSNSTWSPQEKWFEIYIDYKEESIEGQSIKDWLEAKKQQDIEEQAQAWLSLL